MDYEQSAPEDTRSAEELAHRLQAFADSLVTKRKEAIEAKKTSGMDEEWDELEAYYDGCESKGQRWDKAKTLTGPLMTSEKSAPASGRSSIFLNIFQPYVDMGSARANEILVPTNDKPFGIRPTPMQDIQEATNSPDMIPHPQTGEPIPAADIAKQMLAEAKSAAEKAETRIWDWWTEWRWQSEGRKMIDLAAKIGTSVLKGPFPKKFKGKKVNVTHGQTTVEMVESMKPVSKVIHPRNLFPDPACGDSIHDGSYVWERDYITAKQLKALVGSTDSEGNPLYLDDQIALCLKEGPNRKYSDDPKCERSDKDKFEIWYFHGNATHEDMAAAGCHCEEGDVVPAAVTIVNDHVIKAKLSPLDSGEFPYDVFVWQAKPGCWWGIGIGHQVMTPQRMLNAAARQLMDNNGLSAMPILVIDDDHFDPADGTADYTLRPGLTLRRRANSDGSVNARDAVVAINIPNMQEYLMNSINFALQMAERCTGMSAQQEGAQGANQETAAGREILQANAGALMRRICKIFDDRMAPHIARYYEWLLTHGDDESEKGDFVIDVLGSTVMFEKDAKNMLVAQMIDRAANPVYGLNPKKMAQEWLSSQGYDVERIKYTPEEEKQMAEAAANAPKAPAIEVAQIREQGATQRQQIKSQEMMQKIQADTDRDTLYEQTMAQREQTLQSFKERELMLKREIELMKQNSESARLVEELKTKLADTTMKLAMQEKLARIPPDGAPQVANPPSEPPQRAPDGQAFQQ